MNCTVDNCITKASFVTPFGPLCITHGRMIPKSVQGEEVKKFCLFCEKETCIHIEGGVEDTNQTADGKPETLGVSVGEVINTGEAM